MMLWIYRLISFLLAVAVLAGLTVLANIFAGDPFIDPPKNCASIVDCG